MTVRLEPVREPDKQILANLLQLYCHDFSPIRGDELTAHGTFVYRFLDMHFGEGGRDAYFVRHRAQLAGFAMSRTLAGGAREVAEFFVVQAHRRRGVGRRAAQLLFARHPGRWEVAGDDANRPAQAFWPAVVAACAAAPPDSCVEGPPLRAVSQTVIRFATG
ncbi:MAG TPA: GNAT family N-acetyltransferase [Verrucomicrobiae bacterium]|nr:GNAT family N-acetyltransferase [Verrucomicrobiae bacterium]